MAVMIPSSILFAQNRNPLNVTNIVPPSPEVSAIGKYLETPVGYSTGTPVINIPLYTLKQGKLSAPVSLSYNASGIKVEEVASWVGLGWDLNAGGSITRVVRGGLPDDVNPYGYMYTTSTIKHILELSPNSQEYYDIMVTNHDVGTLDIEPDIFIFSIPGYSGKFYFDQQSGKFVMTPLQRIKLDYQVDASNSIKSWQLTTPDGIKYYFGLSKDKQREATNVFQSDQTSNVSSPGGASLPNEPIGQGQHIVTWQLMDIVSPENKIISYNYTKYNAIDFGRGSELKDIQGDSGCDAVSPNTNTSYYKQMSQKTLLSSIVTDEGSIRFIPSFTNRLDMMGDAKRLDSIQVTNTRGVRIKTFVFDYDYFNSGETGPISCPGIGNVTDIVTRRLYLKSLREINPDNTIQLPYRFSYLGNSLPNRLSVSQDLWGYYNGKPNISMIPTYEKTDIQGADRTVQLDYAKQCTLNKIEYPTGGSTEYTYESNVVDATNLAMDGLQLSGRVNKSYIFYKADQFQHPAGSNTYIDTFTIGNSNGQGRIVSSGCDAFNTISCPLKITIKGITDPSYFLWIKQPTYSTLLPPGKYEIKTVISDISEHPDQDFSTEIYWQEIDSLYRHNLIVGGLRLKKIEQKDGFGGRLVKTFSYKDFENNLYSSGILKNVPVFAFSVYCGNREELSPSVLRLVSQSALPLFSSDGQGIMYRNVTEYLDDASTEMKTEYDFSYDWTGFVQPSTTYPYPANVAADWRSGILEHKREYERLSDGSYRIVSSYAASYGNKETIHTNFGIRISPDITFQTYHFAISDFTTEWYTEDSVVNISYTYTADGQPEQMKSITRNIYNPANKYLLSNTRTLDSKGRFIDNKTWYPGDYNDVPGYNINTLLDKNIVEIPVKTETSVAGKLTKGSVFKYDVNGQVVNLFAYESESLKDTIAHDRSMVIPALYNLKTNIIYESAKGNVSVVQNKDNVPESYLWDYAGNYPIAHFINADSTAVAYTSFEADGKGNWSFTGVPLSTVKTVTGNKSYDLTRGAITRAGLQSGKVYILSYWTKNSTALSITGTTGSAVKGRTYNGWNYFEHRITGVGTVSINGSGLIDEVKLYPEGAQVTTFTYEPLIGITCQGNIMDQIIYYEYDGLGRLMVIRDLDGNVLKKYDYQYQRSITQ